MSSSPTDRRVEVVMPALGISIAEGTVVAWRKQPGEAVAYEETICDIATDKIESELPAPAGGTLIELLVASGETVDVGTPIAVIAVAGDAAGHSDAGAPSGVPAGGAVIASAPASHSPLVQRLAAEHGVDLSSVEGSGAGGRVRRQDVLVAASAASARAGGRARPSYVPPEPVALSYMRRQIGANMKRSLDAAATVTSWIEVDFSAVERRRAELETTALPIVAAATIASLAEFPDLNAWLEGERYVRHQAVNLGVAVAVDGGLVVPVICAAQELEVLELAARIRDLASRARAGTLAADELRDGTFTITNPGQFGTIMATPVLNLPQVAILDVEAVVKRPVVVDEQIAIRPICVLGLSWDHRALDGALAARFLAALRRRLETGA
jgi:pyruvate/2-oxoglutarate dehydrogenase complex dihydrolipoamide acyltransferase (E2) component